MIAPTRTFVKVTDGKVMMTGRMAAQVATWMVANDDNDWSRFTFLLFVWAPKNFDLDRLCLVPSDAPFYKAIDGACKFDHD